jgi:membrane protease subunit (stomatin/prohibitin family)|tara:strand:+ start:3203 stop:4192 length:990 start_codon:yes stop_codon:yes gene_type:complete
MAIEVIESRLLHSDEMIQRFPEYGTGEIKWGAQLTVTDGEWAVFFRDGKALEVFDSGRHVLTTQNIPVLTKFVTQFGYGPDSPFRSNVVFVSKKLFPDLKWGTSDPIVFRDPEINIVRLRAFGSQSIRIKDPLLLLNNLVGRQGAFSTKKIENYLRSIIASKLPETLADANTSIFDMASKYSLIAAKTKAACLKEYENIGLEIVDLLINAINPPKSVQEIMDKKSSMSIISDMNQYMQFQTATAIEDAANNTGTAGATMGMGAGLGLGMILPQSMMNSFNANPAQPPAQPAPVANSLETKLKTLKSLLEQDLLTKEEYSAKRTKLLDSL